MVQVAARITFEGHEADAEDDADKEEPADEEMESDA